VNYYLNQLAVRERILAFIHKAITEGINEEEYRDFLNAVHRVQLIGTPDQETVYMGYSKSGEKKYYGVKEKKEWVSEVVAGMRDMTKEFREERLSTSFVKFSDCIKLSPDATREEIVESIVSYYYETIRDLPFGPSNVNNALIMNIVNAMLRLRGFNGISHGYIEFERGKNNFYRLFKEAVDAANPINDAGVSRDKMMHAQLENGGIDLTPAQMHLQVKTGASTGEFGEGIKFHLDSAMLAQLKNAPGFVPVIINIQPVVNLRKFLGLS